MVSLGCAILLGVLGTESNTREMARSAELGARILMDASMAYQLDQSNGGNLPKQLAQLVKPQGGGRSILRNGAADLLDPWGVPYKYEVGMRPNGLGFPAPFVWTERVENGKTLVFGFKPPPKKQ